MGLDMYLIKKIYIGANFEHSNVTGEISLKKDDEPIKINLKKVSYIIEEVAYWRKANSIHNWFVNNVQDGKDDCDEYYVTIEKLKELLGICEKVLESPEENQNLLPTKSGFFFGPSDDLNWYINDLNNTIFQLKEIIKDYEECDDSRTFAGYYYQSSW